VIKKIRFPDQAVSARWDAGLREKVRWHFSPLGKSVNEVTEDLARLSIKSILVIKFLVV
jgi:hypothetical protein